MDVGIKDREEESTWTGTHSRSKIKPSLHCVAGVALLGQFQRRALDGARLQTGSRRTHSIRPTRVRQGWPTACHDPHCQAPAASSNFYSFDPHCT